MKTKDAAHILRTQNCGHACANKLIKTKGRREGTGVKGQRGDRESTQRI